MSLATKLVSLRKQKGLTQTELAERLNVSRQAISRWEVGAAVPSTDNLKILGELYGVPIDYLLNDDTLENTNSLRGTEGNSINEETIHKRTKYKPLLICVAVVAVAVLILIVALVPRNQNREQVIPMENLCSESDDGHTEVTFTIE